MSGKKIETWLVSPASRYLTKHFLTKATIFCCFDVFFVRLPQIFQVHAKMSTIRPVFPDYFSVSYDCDARNLDKYFHFL